MISYDDIEDSIRLDEVIDELGIRITKTARGEQWASCPLDTHPGDDRSESFSINENALLWNCFICGGGRLPMLVAKLEGLQNISVDGEIIKSAWDQAVEWLSPFSDGPTTTDDGFLRQVESLLQAPVRPPVRARRPTLPFMSDRGFSGFRDVPKSLLEPWNIDQGTAIDFGLKYDPEHRRTSGSNEHIGPAIIIPHYFGGDLVGWQERWLGERPEWLPKYTNTDDFPKSLTLWGYDRAIHEPRPSLVVESAMTVIRVRQLGYSAVGTFGAGVSEAQVRLLRGFVHGLWIAEDNDPDYLNKRGQLVKGAGVKTRNLLLDGLCDYVPVEVLPPVLKEKGDLADGTDDEVHALVGRRRAGFLLRPNPKGRGK